MELGMIGLGRMGANMARRLVRAGHRCVVYDAQPEAVAALAREGVDGVDSSAALVGALSPPRVVWLMVPAGVVDVVVTELSKHLTKGDTIVDGGNSRYHDDLRRAATLAEQGIEYVDVGTSGGVWGLARGYCLMIGGKAEIVRRLEPVFEALAPGVDAAPRTPGRAGAPKPAERGYLHCGPVGAGHFVKMVHNGIEYGMMAALAEGLSVLAHANVGGADRRDSAEIAPLARPELYRYEMDLPAIAELWRRGSVIESWLLDLTAHALAEDPKLEGFAGRVSDSGEGRWTVAAAIDEAVPVPVLSAALFERFASRGQADLTGRLLSAMRHEFGGHVEQHVPGS